MEDNTKDLKTLVNKYSKELLNSIEHKSFTEENIKNMLLTNARILALLSDMVSKFANKNELKGLSEKINTVQTKLNEKLNASTYTNHKHKFTGVDAGIEGTTTIPNSS